MNDSERLKQLEKQIRDLRILYVEDNADARISTLMILNQFFGKITTAIDGKDGIEKFEAGEFDIILTDINMPRLNGLQMIQAIREKDKNIPIIVLSAYNEQDYFITSIKLGVDGYLFKPIDIKLFADIMFKVTEKIHLRQENEAYKNNLKKIIREQTKEIEAKAKKLYYQAITDALTGLYNTSMLHETLQKSRNYSYLLILDLVNFSTINKQYGKNFGDDLLRVVSKMLQKHLKKNMRLFKVESDRFAVLVKESTRKEIEDFSKQIISFFDVTNMIVNDNEINVNFTIAISEVGENNDVLMECEYALEYAKKLGRRTYYIYDESSSSMTYEHETIKWLNRTKRLVLENKIEPFFQPILDIEGNKIVKYEVLARGIDGDEVISPFFFLGAAERLGLLTSVTKMIINKSFSFFSHSSHHFSINITEKDLFDDGFIDFIVDKAQSNWIAPSRVTIEILEGITMGTNSSEIIKRLNALREKGFLLAIDDFGVENSNFSRLLDIELDFLKIDAMFIKNIDKSKKDEKIVRAIVSLAKTLDIKTVAEYVESESILKTIEACGVDYAQGYYIGKPLDRLVG